MRRALLLGLALSCPAANALAQLPGVPTITGRVLAASDHVPLRRARIEVSSGPWRAEPVLTDDNGRFSVEVRGSAAVTLTATKGGYTVATTSIRRDRFGTPLELLLPRAAAISGLVLDLKGMPIAGYTVTVRRLDANPERDSAPAQVSGTTDDAGEYRVGGLPRGTYDVAAGSPIPFFPGPGRLRQMVDSERRFGSRSTPVMNSAA